MPRKSKAAKKSSGSGCLVVFLAVIALSYLGGGNAQKSPRTSPTSTRVTEVARSRPTTTPRPTQTNRPTQTTRSSQTQASASVIQPSKTPEATPTTAESQTVRPTTTPRPTQTNRPTKTPPSTTRPNNTSANAEDYTAIGNGNLRSCPQTTCEVIGTVALGERLKVIGSEQGGAVNGLSTWFIIQRTGKPNAYLHASIARQGTPRPAPVVNNTSRPAATQQLASTAPPAQWNCSGNIYNCGDFSNRTQLMSYWNACPGDPSDLDGNKDGVPCESVR